ncbi:38.7K protein [Artaxa digramma nucleopolyhedrovirus]|uniref:38.7K protein n=1 Tax=Artaxa digramma nucleopolyhedrovirus TaxID=3070910 RepID=A0AAE6R670_9ABAC|nr:38.7K protein [Euproctis digramma nucleopolyhedrovirus]QHB21792.1 38.7K protein [Artaxa digramma nucleopolyhedrovirus]
MFQIIGKLFNSLFFKRTNDDEDGDEDKNYNDEHDNKKFTKSTMSNANFSYLFQTKKIYFNGIGKTNTDDYVVLKYFIKDKTVWLCGKTFARAIGFENFEHALYRCVDFENARPTSWLLRNFNETYRHVVNDENDDDDEEDENVKNKQNWCINKMGAIQLLDNIDFENKAQFIVCLLETFNELETEEKKECASKYNVARGIGGGGGGASGEDKDEEKLIKVLKAVEIANKNNTMLIENNNSYNSQLIDKFCAFEERFAERLDKLNKKIDYYDNIEDLFTKLCENHNNKDNNNKKTKRNDGTLGSASNLTFLSETCSSLRDYDGAAVAVNKYETVKFPRNVLKHPRLAVYVKPAVDDRGTQLAFLSGQQRTINARKRKFRDMELILDCVHPNPLLALNCFDEDLESKKFNFYKKTKRLYHIDSDIETVKNFINENI